MISYAHTHQVPSFNYLVLVYDMWMSCIAMSCHGIVSATDMCGPKIIVNVTEARDKDFRLDQRLGEAYRMVGANDDDSSHSQ
jgi:hypothetical protein